MKRLILALAAIIGGSAQAAPLAPVTGGTLAGIPLAQALGTIDVLGEPGGVRLINVMSRSGGECGVSGIDDADTCGRFTLLAVAYGETSVLTDFTVFRLPETLGWKIPKGSKPQRGKGNVAIPLSACEMKKTARGYGWKGTSYLLRVTEDLRDFPGGAHYVFTADLQKLPGERRDCAN